MAWPCNDTKYIVHFPETREIWSYGSGYGGNALLGKKCFALRIASVLGRDEGWMAEHMLVLKITGPDGRVYHLAAAFPSACGKTNLAMLRPTIPGWKVETIGDDIAWMRPGPDGRLYAINPEAGFFGVAPGTGESTNPTAIAALDRDVIFTNVALTDDGDVWWEGLTDEVPAHLVDWQGNDWTPDAGRPAAHPNSRFTVPRRPVPVDRPGLGGPRRACRSTSSSSAGAARRTSRSWPSPTTGSTGCSSAPPSPPSRPPPPRGPWARCAATRSPCCPSAATTWPTTGATGWRWARSSATRRRASSRSTGSARVHDGTFLWPGFGENSRVLEWALRRVNGEVGARDAATGRLPRPEDLNLEGLDLSEEDLAELFAIDPASWAAEADLTEEYFAQFGARLPDAMTDQLAALRERLGD